MMSPMNLENLIRKARKLGIKDPHLMTPSDLGRAVQLYEQVNSLRRHARSIGIELPPEGNKGMLERLFRDAVTKRLQGITPNSEVTCRGRTWTVEGIHPVRNHSRSSNLYVLRPVGGGKVAMVSDFILVGYLYREKR